ncbi:MAG: D-2-hydroxyacid dehydrogenase [Proteobacteria bacterium]|nr:D-2-hydroxyacid dehydrogenase [Pseudomonadota bacterium]
MKAVFLDSEGLDEFLLDELTGECTALQVFRTTSPEEVANRIAGAELVILNKVPISRDHLLAAPSVRLICVVATGTDVVELLAASELGVTVCNCQAYGTDSVVQHVFATILALHTNLLSYHGAVRAGHWQNARQFCFLDYPIIELKGKTIGIVGYGTLGRAIADMARAFGMKIMVARRPGGPPDDRPTLAEMLPEIDILTLHCPLTDYSRNLIDGSAIALMKPSAFLVNAARGGIVDEVALAEALRSGKIAGAAIDVLSSEPPRLGNPLLDPHLPNLILTPHIAWASREARQRILDQTAENIRAFKEGAPIRVVNDPSRECGDM